MCGGVVYPVIQRSDVQRLTLEQQIPILVRRNIEIEPILFDVLKSEEINEAEGIVIARVLLIVGADSKRISGRVSRRVVVFRNRAKLDRSLKRVATAEDGCAGVN